MAEIEITLNKENAEVIADSLNFLFKFFDNDLKNITAEADMERKTIRLERPFQNGHTKRIIMPFGAEITGEESVIFPSIDSPDAETGYRTILSFVGNAFNFRWENHWVEIDAEYVVFHDSEYFDNNATAIDL